jgi:methylisocitrate lyase
VAAGSLGLPDLGISNLDDVLTDIRRITDVCDTPLLVDVDTGFGASAFNVARTTRSLIKFGAAAMHIEDQVGAKRCGHRPNKEIVTRAKWSTASRPPSMPAPTRTSSSWPAPTRWPWKAWTRHRARRGLRGSRRRHDLPGSDDRPGHVPQFVDAVKVPVLANITEFGATPCSRWTNCATPALPWCCTRCRPSAP